MNIKDLLFVWGMRGLGLRRWWVIVTIYLGHRWNEKLTHEQAMKRFEDTLNKIDLRKNWNAAHGGN